MRGAGSLRPWRLLAGLAFLAAWGCRGPEPSGQWEGWEREPLRSAEFFQLWHRGEERLLITFGPGGMADTTGLFIMGPLRGGGPWPARAVVLQRPVRRVALLSTTHASFISALGLAEAVAGCAHTERLRDPEVAALAKAGRLAEIGNAEGLDREKVAMLAPDAVFVYPYGQEAATVVGGRAPVVPIAEYLERNPLGRAEWLRVFGVLLGRDALAQALVDSLAGRYAKAAASLPKEGRRPGVFFGSSWRGTWSVPAGNSYMAALIADAGGHYLFAGRRAEGNLDLDLETVLQQGGGAQRWGRILELDRPVTAAEVAGDDPRIMALPAFTQGGAFYANSMESDLFGQASLEPDVILLDLIGIFHPELRGGRQPVYFKPVQ